MTNANTTNTNTNTMAGELQAELTKGLTSIQTLRDEIRVHLHLAGMDVKKEWDALEPSLLDIEKRAEAISDATRAAVSDAVSDALSRMTKIRAALTQ